MKFSIAIEQGTEGTAFGVVVPDLPGCFSAGDTIEEAFDNAHEAIDTFCELVAENGGDLPKTRPMSEWQQDPQFKGWTWGVVDVPIDRYFQPSNPMSPLEDYLEHIERALEAEIYYAALALALAIPDICASCELPPNAPTTKATYQEWCRSYFPDSLDPHELYTLRCSFLHNGTTEFSQRHPARGNTAGVSLGWHGAHPHGMIAIELVDPSSPGPRRRMHDVALLCRWMIAGARKWYAARSNLPSVAENLSLLTGIKIGPRN